MRAKGDAENSKLTSLAQLKGENVAFPAPGFNFGSMAADILMAPYGLSSKSFTTVVLPFSAAQEALAKGEVDAAFTTEPFITIAEKTAGDLDGADRARGQRRVRRRGAASLRLALRAHRCRRRAGVSAVAPAAGQRVRSVLANRLTLLAARLLVLAAAVAGWQFGTGAADSPYFLPPSAIVSAMYHQWFSGPASHLWLSPRRDR